MAGRDGGHLLALGPPLARVNLVVLAIQPRVVLDQLRSWALTGQLVLLAGEVDGIPIAAAEEIGLGVVAALQLMRVTSSGTI